MQKLVELLQHCPDFNDTSLESYVPLDKQAVYLKMAERFQEAISHLYEDPEELAQSTDIKAELWEDFLDLDAVTLYAAVRTKKLATTTARKSLRNLQLSANKGDVSAIKYLNEISGIINKQGDTGQIILHYVPRPTAQQVTEEDDEE